MKTKKCFKCSIEKPLNEYYKHKKMGDGHLNKCKNCTKSDVKKRHDILINDKDWKKAEQKRQREKYYRLGYKDKHKPILEKKYEYAKSHRNKYPEKYKAKNATIKMKRGIGNNLHHWSYNKEHYKDVIELSILEHNLIHRFMIYDQERFMYRRIDTMELLDTKERHLDYINYIIKNKE